MEYFFNKPLTLEPSRTDVQEAHSYAKRVIQHSRREDIWIDAMIGDLDGKWFVPTRVAHHKVYRRSELGDMVSNYWEYVINRTDDEFEDLDDILSRAGQLRSKICEIVVAATDPQTGRVHPDVTISDHARPRPHPDGSLQPYYHWREEDLHDLARGFQRIMYEDKFWTTALRGVPRVFWREDRKIIDDTREIDWNEEPICVFEYLNSLCGDADVIVR